MGRDPSSISSKAKCRRGLWSPEEDEKLRSYILQHGHGCWTSLPINSGLQRNGKSCRLRWMNYLRPGLKREVFTPNEEEIILTLHRTLGNKWSKISHHLPGRTDNDIKNHWHSCMKNKKTESKIKETRESKPTIGPSTINSVTRIPSTESLSSVEGSQLALKGCQSLLPRLLFAEWLNMENEQNYDHSQSVNPNPNEVFCSSSFGNNVCNQDTSSSMSNSFGNKDENIENYVVDNIHNRQEVKDEDQELDNNLAFLESIFEDEIYNDFFGSYDLKQLQY